MRAPLADFLSAVTSGHNVLTPEMYAYFGGDKILEELHKYDPNASFTDTEISGGEGGGSGMGKRLDVDLNKLPKSQRGSVAAFNLNPSNLHENLKHPGSAAYLDPIYGSVRNSNEFAPDTKTALETWGPIVVAALATAGAALPAMTAYAGGTAAVTGGAAGLEAGNIALGGAGNLFTSALQKAPQLANSISQSGGKVNPLGALMTMFGGQAGSIPGVGEYAGQAMTLAQIARMLANARKP